MMNLLGAAPRPSTSSTSLFSRPPTAPRPALSPDGAEASVAAFTARSRNLTAAPPQQAPSRVDSQAAATLRDDRAHVWWPKQFDGIAYAEHLERLVHCQHAARSDVLHAFESLQLVEDTLRGTPARELLAQVRRILRAIAFRPNTDGVLALDLVMGLELEAAQLRTQLVATKRAYERLKSETARHVDDANARRVTTDIIPTMESAAVAEATMQRVQRESAEMATRLQQSLAQQQVVRAKQVDLGLRNLELRQVLEAQKRAATARSWEDALPVGLMGDDAAQQQQQATLDRSALHIMGDVVSSSQVELANLIEHRQRMATAVFGE